MFGFIGSGAILGWIVGGLVTRTGVSQFGTENMLAFVALFLLLPTLFVALLSAGSERLLARADSVLSLPERIGLLGGGRNGGQTREEG